MTTLYKNDILDAIYAHASNQYQDKVAIQEAPGKRITYRDFVSSVENLARNLVQNGFRKGDRVLMLVRPNINTLKIVLAVVRAGGVLVIADPAMGQTVFSERMKLAKPTWVFAESIILLLQKFAWLRRLLRQRGIEIPEMGEIGIPNVVSVGKLPFFGTHRLGQLEQASGQSVPMNETVRENHEDITIVFTSGTTGTPKGVVHTIGSMLSTIQRVRDYADLHDKDVIYDTGILFILPALMAGARVVMGQGKFSPEKTVQIYHDYGVTKTLEIPSNMKAIAKYLRDNHATLPSTLDDLMLGAAPVFADFLRDLREVTHPSTRIWSIYGMTEILPTALVSIDDKLAFERDGGDLVGMPMQGLCAEIAPDGELLLSGAGLYDRYLGYNPIRQHETGDMARLDENGRIVLLGRKKDMIIRGKHNIYPPLFEPTIRHIEGVADCAMVGVYNPDSADEEIVLFIELEPNKTLSAKDIQAQLLSGEHSIDLYAQPEHIIFEAIPYSGRSLKMDKKALRERARQHLGIRDDSTANLFEAAQA